MTKLISWNVNGIRAVIKKGFLDFVKEENPDIICVQETKAHPDQVDEMLHDYPHHFWNTATKKGYSGTAIFSKIKPLNVRRANEELNDDQGRTIILEFENFHLLTVYTPNSKRELERLAERQIWDKDFLNLIKHLEKKKPVIVCGDLNCAHKEIDIARPKTNRRTAGFTDEERAGMTNYIEHGLIDTFREFNKEPDNYTWWSYMRNSREKNIGWRIDYFLISKVLRPILKDAFIKQEILGSDHCPVGIIIKLKNLNTPSL